MRRHLKGSQAKKKSRTAPRPIHLHEPVKTLVAEYEKRNPGTVFTWLANKALWELLKPLAGKRELALAAETHLDTATVLLPKAA